MNEDFDRLCMCRALEAAREAGVAGEVPVGAVITRDQEIIAVAGNAPIASRDPTAHAEIRVLRMAGEQLGNYRLPNTTLYVTLEPCVMCIGAMIHARVTRLVFAAEDPKSGAAGTVFDLARSPQHNHVMQVSGGILADEAARMLREFFAERRREQRS